jgi:hypothetical protein
MSSPSSTLADSGHEDDTAEDRFFVEVAPFLFLMTKEDNSEDDDESQGPDPPDSSADSASSDKVLGPEEDTLRLDKTQVEEVRAVAADTEFLEDIGLTPQAFIALLDGTEVQWSEGEADQD